MDVMLGVILFGIPLAIALFAVFWLTMGGAARPVEFTGTEPDRHDQAKVQLEQDYDAGRITLEEYRRRLNALEDQGR